MSVRPEELPLEQTDLKALMILVLGLCSGPVLMVVPAVLLSAQRTGPPPSEEQLALVQTLSAVHAFVALGGFTASLVVFKAAFFGKRPELPSSANAQAIADEGLTAVRSATILRFALMEAPAMLGMAVCLIAATSGVLAQQPLVWLNALSALLLIAFALVNFPTESRVRGLIAERHRRATEG